MGQYLKRGYTIIPECKVTRMLSQGDEWQIYMTSNQRHALAITPELYDIWKEKYYLPTGIFMDDLLSGYRVFLSTSNYIISSMENGPYPENSGQVEAFSIAFNTATKLFKGTSIQDAIYIEEYSLLMPVSQDGESCDLAIIYAKWLTGGINISIESYDRVSEIMSWLAPDRLLKSANAAGFNIKYQIPTNKREEGRQPSIDEPEKYDISLKESININKHFSLIGRPDLEKFLNENIIDIVMNQEKYERMGIPFPGATILYGPPGCGKTYAVERLTEFLGWQRFDIDSSTIASSYIHETSKKISEVFQNAIDSAPSILVIDEMEAFLTNRSMAGPSGIHHLEEVAEFLRRIPEAISKGVLVFAMTNMIDSIDPAILRRGRFDHIIEVKMATAEEIEMLLANRFCELPIEQSVDAKELAKELDGHPMSDIAFVLREAGRFAVKSNLEEMNKECFEKALDLLPKKKEKQRIGFNI